MPELPSPELEKAACAAAMAIGEDTFLTEVRGLRGIAPAMVWAVTLERDRANSHIQYTPDGDRCDLEVTT